MPTTSRSAFVSQRQFWLKVWLFATIGASLIGAAGIVIAYVQASRMLSLKPLLLSPDHFTGVSAVTITSLTALFCCLLRFHTFRRVAWGFAKGSFVVLFFFVIIFAKIFFSQMARNARLDDRS